MENQVSEKPETIKPSFRMTILPAVGVSFLSLLYWEVLLHVKSGADFLSPFPLPFLLAEALLLTALGGWMREKGNFALQLVLQLIPCAFYLVQLTYYCQFGSFASMSMAGMGTAALTTFYDELADTVKNSAGVLALCFVPPAAYIALHLLHKAEIGRYRLRSHGILLLLAAAAWALGIALLPLGGTDEFTAYDAYHNSATATDLAASRLGMLTTSVLELLPGSAGNASEETDDLVLEEMPAVPESLQKQETEDTETGKTWDNPLNTIEAIDFNALGELAQSEAKQSLCSYFASVEGTAKNDMTGYFEGYNLIYICGEAFDSVAIDPELTPLLYKMANGGIVLSNYYNSFPNTTTNGEYAMMLGLWPDVGRDADEGSHKGSFFSSSKCYLPFSLAHMFAQEGVESWAYHGYSGNYYGRNVTHPNLGYTARFAEDGLTFSTRWPTSDLELMEQTVDDYIGQDRFHAYYMSFSGHGNYNRDNPIDALNYDYVKSVVGDRGYSEKALCYLAGNYELEKALEYLVQRLDEAGKLDNTLFVIAGDHYPYALDSVSYGQLNGGRASGMEAYRSTCIIWSSSVEKPIVNDAYCCNVDILPTVLNLLGMEYDSRLLSGTDVFSDGLHVAMLYNRSFLTETASYNTENRDKEWTDPDNAGTKEELNDYVSYVSSVVKARYSAALRLTKNDFYRWVWENSGLPTE